MDNIIITVDSEGSVVSVTHSVRGSGNCKEGLSRGEVDALDEFSTEVVVRATESAPIPDTASFIQKMERERESREKGETKDNRGFFAKYVSFIGLPSWNPNNLLIFLAVDVHCSSSHLSAHFGVCQSRRPGSCPSVVKIACS